MEPLQPWWWIIHVHVQRVIIANRFNLESECLGKKDVEGLMREAPEIPRQLVDRPAEWHMMPSSASTFTISTAATHGMARCSSTECEWTAPNVMPVK